MDATPAKQRCPRLRATLRWLAFYVGVYLCLYGAFWVVDARFQLGADQQASLDALRADPAAFVWYTLELPDSEQSRSPLALGDSDESVAEALIRRWRAPRRNDDGGRAADDSDFAALFMLAYGAWTSTLDAAAAGRLLKRHCGAREFEDIVAKRSDPAACGGAAPAEPGACRGGYYADDAGLARTCPDGTFCPNGQTCFVLCARGAMCNASRPLSGVVASAKDPGRDDPALCGYPRGAAATEPRSPETGKCPGAAHLTLCPTGYYCRTPVEIERCPPRHFCALGSDRPTKCPWFGDCRRGGLDRPRYRRWFSAFLWAAGILLTAGYYVASLARERMLRRLDEALADLIELARPFAPRRSDHRASPLGAFDEEALPRAAPVVDVEFADVTVVLPGGRVAVDGATGAFRAGRVTAILGPSGAGKSTLLDLVVGRVPAAGAAVAGGVALNGLAPRDVSPALVGAVPQDEHSLLGWLTVRELVRFYAAIRERRERVPAGESRAAAARRRERRVALVLRELGLYGERDAYVGVAGDARRRGLSGGQRKRASVAVELVADPSVLVLDEPTSGLDASTADAVLLALKNAAARGVCVAAVLHQPSARMWRSVDDAIIFAAAGRVAYVGAAAAAAAAFEGACGAFCVRDPGDAPPDYVLECVCHGGFDGAAVVSVKRAARPQPATAAATAAALAAASRSVEAPGARDQFLLHVPRAVLALTRAPSEFVFEVSVQLAAGAFLGALYPHFEFGDSQQVAFILQLSLGGTIALSSARTFGTTRQALWRELAPNLGGMGLGATPMFAATCLVELPRLALLTLAFLSTWFPTASPRCAFARYFAPCFGAALAASGAAHVANGAAQESDIPNFKGSDLGRFPLVLADFWTNDHLSERSRSVDALSGTRAKHSR